MARMFSLLLPALALLVAPMVRADPLDTVLNVLYKAGVIDGNVKAAKPLIACLADGGNAISCAAGNAGQTELANDPQVRNVIDIYLAFNDQDYYTVLKKAGITVGCALIPGGEVKDIACGELGKIAAQVVDGVGSVLAGFGGAVISLFGGGSDPKPMSEEAYYTLNFMPWYHWSVVHQLDNDTPANVQVLNAPVPACVDYFYHHTYDMDDAKKACGDLRMRLNNSGYALGNAFRDETDSYFQLHFAPKIDEWAEVSFANSSNINTLAAGAQINCLVNERKKIPLPEPGFEQCDAIDPNAGGPLFVSALQQVKNQCVALATQRTVPKDNDAYTRICTPMTNRVTGKIILAMAELKSRMDKAAAAGCPNSGKPKSILCGSYQTQAACQVALPEHPTMCALDSSKALSANIEQIWAAINTDDAPCTAFGEAHSNLACPHPMQQLHCGESKKAIEDAWGAQSVAGITCDAFEDPSYQQRKQQALQGLAASNAEYPSPGLHLQSQALIRATPIAPCQLARHDPLVISCAEGFRLEAIPERATAVYESINADNQGGRPRSIYCLPDIDNDGAEAPCLEGGPAPELPPPAMRLRPKALIRADGGGG